MALRIELKMECDGKAFAAALEFEKERQSTKCVSHEVWLLMHSAIRTLQKKGILDEVYFWEIYDSQVEQIESTSSDRGNDNVCTVTP